MKKKYERPMMIAEAYETNEYVCACWTRVPLMEVNINSNNWHKTYNWGTKQFVDVMTTADLGETYVTKHVFYGDATPMKNFSNDDQYYWTCVCNDYDNYKHDSPAYFLEFSIGYTNEVKSNTYFLYQDTNLDNSLQLSKAKEIGNSQRQWPNRTNNDDIAVAAVTYGTTPTNS